MDGITFTAIISAEFTREQVMDLRRCVVKEINRNNDLLSVAYTERRDGHVEAYAREITRLRALKEVLMAL